MSNKRYFPNKWELISSCPSIAFASIEYDHFMEWRGTEWELPEQITCVIRTDHIKTGKIKEFTYKSATHASRKIRELVDSRTYNITLCFHDSIHYIPNNFADHDGG